MNNPSKLVIFDPTLKSFDGHAYFYNLGIVEAAEPSFEKIKIYAHPDLKNFKTEFSSLNYIHIYALLRFFQNAVATFYKFQSPKKEKVDSSKKEKKGWIAKIKLFIKSIIFFIVFLQMLLHENRKGQRSIVFVQYVTLAEIYALLKIDQLLLRKIFKHTKVCLVLRYDPHHLMGTRKTGAILKKLHWSNSLRLFTDSDQLTKSYKEKFSDLSIVTLPVPVYLRSSKRTKLKRSKSGITVGFLGATRKEKGFEHLPNLLKGIKQISREKRIVTNFCIQINDGHDNSLDYTKALLRSYRKDLKGTDEKFQILDGPLALKAYIKALEKIDVMLLPYTSTKYIRSTSGLFVEALHHQIAVVCPRGSWSGVIIEEASVKNLKIGECFESLEEIPALVNKIAENFEQYHDDLVKYSKYNSNKNCAEKIVLKLCQEK